jgi:hypothetical protein
MRRRGPNQMLRESWVSSVAGSLFETKFGGVRVCACATWLRRFVRWGLVIVCCVVSCCRRWRGQVEGEVRSRRTHRTAPQHPSSLTPISPLSMSVSCNSVSRVSGIVISVPTLIPFYACQHVGVNSSVLCCRRSISRLSPFSRHSMHHNSTSGIKAIGKCRS